MIRLHFFLNYLLLFTYAWIFASGNGFGTEKTLCVERVGVTDENGLQELFPTSLNILK